MTVTADSLLRLARRYRQLGLQFAAWSTLERVAEIKQPVIDPFLLPQEAAFASGSRSERADEMEPGTRDDVSLDAKAGNALRTQVHVELAELALERGLLELARSYLDRADGESSALHLARAEVALALGNDDAADSEFRAVVGKGDVSPSDYADACMGAGRGRPEACRSPRRQDASS